jgi:hypothetical protein
MQVCRLASIGPGYVTVKHICEMCDQYFGCKKVKSFMINSISGAVPYLVVYLITYILFMSSEVALHKKFTDFVFCRRNFEMFMTRKCFPTTNTLCYVILSESNEFCRLEA